MNLSIWICTIEYYSTHQWPHDWKRSVFIPILKMGNAKECSNYGTTVLISHVSNIMLKILQARLQQYVNRELPDVHTWFQRSRGIRDQIDNICGSWRKQGSSRKASDSTSLTTLKPLTVWITTNWKILQKMGIPDHLTWETCMWVKKQHLESDMKQLTSSKLGKEYDKAVYCHPAYLTFIQSKVSKVAQSCPTLRPHGL